MLTPVAVGSQVAGDAKPVTAKDLATAGVVVDDRAFVKKASVWPNPIIPVCWEGGDGRHKPAQTWVETAATETWEKVSRVKFDGWPTCVDRSVGVRIMITDGPSYTDGLGTELDGRRPCANIPNGPPCRVYMNLDVATWPKGSCTVSAETCIKAMAVHELGHVLALSHEQNAPKAPFECSVKRSGPDGDLPLTPFDADSVMNYCRPLFDKPIKLSKVDIQFAQDFYGRRDR